MHPVTVAMLNLTSPIILALLIGWVLTVVLHEFAHGVVALWGGDYTIRERGGVSLNPLQYVHPVNSILLPIIFLLLGGVPLPGGVNYVRMDLLRSRMWQSAVSLAGPAMNILLFLIGAIALHPKVGWVGSIGINEAWAPPQQLVAALTVLQLFAAIINLVPMPPLDGFGVISPYLKPETRYKLTTPPTSTGLMIMTFVLIWSPVVQGKIFEVISNAFQLLGYEQIESHRVLFEFSRVLSGTS